MSDHFSLMPSIGISSSGLDAESRRMEVIANNIANANTTRGADGKLFQRKQVVFAAKLAEVMKNGNRKAEIGGVEVRGVVEDTRAPKKVFRPGHPDADPEGYVEMPDINPTEEMMEMMSTSRAYEANLAAIKTARSMAQQALSIGGK